ncbi:MAG: hypothetical protein K0S31_3216 [Sphingobacterium multivorum]|nr:hypothetical protein [Sphingobacterium multivorum]
MKQPEKKYYNYNSQRVKPYLYYLKNTFWINLAISILFGTIAAGLINSSNFPLLSSFSIVFTTIGYLLTFLIFLYFVKNKKYLYYNMGVSIFHLFIFGFVFNIVFVSPFFIISQLA